MTEARTEPTPLAYSSEAPGPSLFSQIAVGGGGVAAGLLAAVIAIIVIFSAAPGGLDVDGPPRPGPSEARFEIVASIVFVVIAASLIGGAIAAMVRGRRSKIATNRPFRRAFWLGFSVGAAAAFGLIGGNCIFWTVAESRP